MLYDTIIPFVYFINYNLQIFRGQSLQSNKKAISFKGVNLFSYKNINNGKLPNFPYLSIKYTPYSYSNQILLY